MSFRKNCKNQNKIKNINMQKKKHFIQFYCAVLFSWNAKLVIYRVALKVIY